LSPLLFAIQQTFFLEILEDDPTNPINLKNPSSDKKNGARIEIQPRFKIQYPMKNQYNSKVVFSLLQYHFWGIYPRFGRQVENKEKFCRIKKDSIFALQNTK
jgi:hypothetical protein